MNEALKLILIDTCGETAGVAVCEGQQVLASEDLERGSASAEIVSALKRLLDKVGWRLKDVDAVGVVNGPGSFTGMRAGLAAAKGLCEAAGLRLAAVSRLEVLANATALRDGNAVLDAGRGEVYVRDIATGKERVLAIGEVRNVVEGRRVVAGDGRSAEALTDWDVVIQQLQVTDSLDAVLRCLKEGGSDVATIDANYVRGESELYRKQGIATNDMAAGAR